MKKFKLKKKSRNEKFIGGFIASIQSYSEEKQKVASRLQFFFVVAILIAVLLIPGCITFTPTASGPVFTKEDATSDDSAVVYVYNPMETRGTIGYHIWCGKSITPEAVLEANEGTILLYPVSVLLPESWTLDGISSRWRITAARYYDLAIIMDDQDEQEDSQKKSEFSMIDVAKTPPRGGSYSVNPLVVSKYIGNTRISTTMLWSIESTKLLENLENDIALAKEHPEINLMNVRLAPEPLIAKAYFTLKLKPGKTNFWVCKDQLLDGHIPPYFYPGDVLTIDLKPGKKYFLKLSGPMAGLGRFRNITKPRLDSIPASEALNSGPKSILDCRRSDVKSDN